MVASISCCPRTLVVALFCFLLLTLQANSLRITGATNGTNPTTGERPFRREINEFAGSGASWDLYILALQRMQSAPSNDPLSYYQIAGIHGYPNVSWDGVAGSGSAVGYCMHRSVLFAIWHRPYLALFEQAIFSYALYIADKYPLDRRDEYVAAANTLRIPYWDWAQIYSLPDVVTAATLRVNTPEGPANVTNPLLQYNFPKGMAISDIFPYPTGFAALNYTARNYNLSTGESDDQASSASLLAASASRIIVLYHLLSSTNNWDQFSAISVGGDASLEALHGWIHNDIGGYFNGIAHGHMTMFTMSAFDPVFWLHHANVDRITAIWQALNPDSYVEPAPNAGGTYFQPANQVDNIDSALAPFHTDDNNTMWTARMARGTSTFGYTYPELVDWNVSASELKGTVQQKVNQLYNPNPPPTVNVTRRMRLRRSANLAGIMSNVHVDSALELGVNNLDTQWYLRISIPASMQASAYFFVGNAPASAESWSRAKNLVGSYVPPFGYPSSSSAQQIDVPCTHTIAAAVDRGILQDFGAGPVVSFLRTSVVSKVISTTGGTESDNIQISILSRAVEPRKSLTEFPVYGRFQNHGLLSVS